MIDRLGADVIADAIRGLGTWIFWASLLLAALLGPIQDASKVHRRYWAPPSEAVGGEMPGPE